MTTRNIFNSDKINIFLQDIIKKKSIDNKNIEKWILSNCKNYLLKNWPIKEISLDNLSNTVQKIIIQKNIKPPYHIVDLTPDLNSKIYHILDFFSNQFCHQ